jgi:hypothetical protein
LTTKRRLKRETVRIANRLASACGPQPVFIFRQIQFGGSPTAAASGVVMGTNESKLLQGARDGDIDAVYAALEEDAHVDTQDKVG